MRQIFRFITCCSAAATIAGCIHRPSGPPLSTVIDPAGCCYLYEFALLRQQKAINLSFLPAFMEFDRGIHLIKNERVVRRKMQDFLGRKTNQEAAFTMALHGITCRAESSPVFGKTDQALNYLACRTSDTLSPLFLRRWEMSIFFKDERVSDVLVYEAVEKF